MKVKAGNGLCFIESKKGTLNKVRIILEDNKYFCMYKGKRYLLLTQRNKIVTKVPDSSYITVTLNRARKRNSYNTKTNSRRKRRSKRRPRSLFNSRRSKKHLSKVKFSKVKFSKLDCKKRLSNKIARNIREFKKGKFVSRSQAIAVSYSQIKEKYPECKKWFTK